jgi:hypothetical protein
MMTVSNTVLKLLLKGFRLCVVDLTAHLIKAESCEIKALQCREHESTFMVDKGSQYKPTPAGPCVKVVEGDLNNNRQTKNS